MSDTRHGLPPTPVHIMKQITKPQLTARESLIRDFLLEMLLTGGLAEDKVKAARRYADSVLEIDK